MMKPLWLLVLLLIFPLFALADAQSRIVSVGAGATELIYLLGAQKKLVAVDSSSRWPKSAQTLPNVGYHRLLSAEGILALHPNLVIGSDEMGPKAVISQLKKTGVKILKLNSSVTDKGLHKRIKSLGVILNKQTEAAKIWQQYEQKKRFLVERNQQIKKPLKAILIISPPGMKPLLAGKNTAADKLIDLAGVVNSANSLTNSYKALSEEALLAANPDVILLASDQKNTQKIYLRLLQTQPALAYTEAGKNKRIVLVDASVLVSGGSPRLLDVADKLFSTLYGTDSNKIMGQSQ